MRWREPEGETIKTLFATADDRHVEAVLMFYPDRVTACVSCQVGCPIRCTFCATGLDGLERNLTTGEIVAQVVTLARRARAAGRTLTNVVMMGMGEPLANYEPTLKFIGIINDPAGLGFGARRITVSTAGIVPGHRSPGDEPQAVNLAVSLHAPDGRVAQLAGAAQPPLAGGRTARGLSLVTSTRPPPGHLRVHPDRGMNDAPELAEELARKLQGLLCHVNLIPCNPTPAGPFQPPSHAAIDRFAATLRAAGIATTVRWSRGVAIAAACGQLRAEDEGVVPLHRIARPSPRPTAHAPRRRMTTIAYFDCPSGISGDMTLGALVDAGLPLDALAGGLRAALPALDGYRLEAERVSQHGIGGTRVSRRARPRPAAATARSGAKSAPC